MKALIAEDDRHIREGLREILEEEGYEVVEAPDGAAAFRLFQEQSPDLILLDIMMPGENGYEVLKKIRKASAEIPVIFISAKSTEIDKVVGLELGADDFIVKPFGVREVAARVRAVSRRVFARKKPTDVAEEFTIGDLRVVPATLRAHRGETTIDLSLREVKLLTLFAENPKIALDRDRISDAVWGHGHIPSSRTLDQQIAQLRKKIERDPANPVIIRTVHGIGYRYE
jgi:DNA-binding response OmpR family regulator